MLGAVGAGGLWVLGAVGAGGLWVLGVLGVLGAVGAGPSGMAGLHLPGRPQGGSGDGRGGRGWGLQQSLTDRGGGGGLVGRQPRSQVPFRGLSPHAPKPWAWWAGWEVLTLTLYQPLTGGMA